MYFSNSQHHSCSRSTCFTEPQRYLDKLMSNWFLQDVLAYCLHPFSGHSLSPDTKSEWYALLVLYCWSCPGRCNVHHGWYFWCPGTLYQWLLKGIFPWHMCHWVHIWCPDPPAPTHSWEAVHWCHPLDSQPRWPSAHGRAQELLLILDEYWSNHPAPHKLSYLICFPSGKGDAWQSIKPTLMPWARGGSETSLLTGSLLISIISPHWKASRILRWTPKWTLKAAVR